MLGFTTNVTAQTYDYSVNWSDTSTFKTSCGKVVPAQWSVKNESCEMTTPHFRAATAEGCNVNFNFKINQSGSGDSTDKCYTYHQIDNGDWVLDSVIIAGAGTPSVRSIIDSIHLGYGHFVQFKIRMSTNSQSDFWAIIGGGMKVSAGDTAAHKITIWTGNPPAIPTLPVELITFNGTVENGAVVLNWATATETNNDYFTIEKSKDAINFETVAFAGGAGNSNVLLLYSTIDNAPFQDISYYRLKQTDFDGKYTYSNLVKVDFVHQMADNVSIYPNPFNTSATIMIKEVSQMINYELRIYNVLGAEVMNTSITNQITTLETSDLPSGIYSYKLFENDKTIQSGKLISQQ